MPSLSSKPHYFTIEEAIRIHKLVMSGTNQPPQAIKDLISKNTLGSALARPKQLAHYEAADLIRQAALMCISISQAQTFVDGNKRTANIARFGAPPVNVTHRIAVNFFRQNFPFQLT